jgi:microcystin-dependent protein
MNNLQDLSDAVTTINFKTLPSIYELFRNVALHIGEYKLSSRASDFNGWLKCDGRSLSRVEYSELFEIIGTSFGHNDNDTFKLPDLRGRVLGGIGQGSGLTNRTLGTMVGTETHTLISAEMPSHSHTGTTDSNGVHTHTINDPGHRHTQTTINDDFNNSGTNPPGFTQDSAGSMTWSNINTATTGISINSAGAHTHTLTTNTTGGNQAHNNMQPTAFIGNVFIYAKFVPHQPIIA